jgi:hypothetical protein
MTVPGTTDETGQHEPDTMSRVRTGPVVSDRLLLALTITLAALLAVAVIVSLVFWHTPAAQPIDVPSVQQT